MECGDHKQQLLKMIVLGFFFQAAASARLDVTATHTLRDPKRFEKARQVEAERIAPYEGPKIVTHVVPTNESSKSGQVCGKSSSMDTSFLMPVLIPTYDTCRSGRITEPSRRESKWSWRFFCCLACLKSIFAAELIYVLFSSMLQASHCVATRITFLRSTMNKIFETVSLEWLLIKSK